MMRRMWFATLVVACCLAGSFAAGCATRRVSTTSRTAMEQLLLSTAVDKALKKLDLPMLKERKVYLDFKNLKGTDVEYLQVALRAKVAQDGSILVDEAKDADYVMEVASGALAMEDTGTLVGMPAMPIPQAPVALPEVPLYKEATQTAILKMLIFVHQKGKFVACDQYFARGDRDESFLLWYRFQRKDDVKEGWEHAEADLAVKTAEPVANGPKEPAKKDHEAEGK